MEQVFSSKQSASFLITKTTSKIESNARKHSVPREVQQAFALAVFQAKQKNPNLGWKKYFDEARKVLPDPNMLGQGANHPNQYKWLVPLLDQLEKANKKDAAPSPKKEEKKKITKEDKDRLSIDHRQSLPVVKETTTLPEEKTRKKQGAKNYLKPEDKLYFAEVVYRMRQSNAGVGWRQILIDANDEMPAHKRLSGTPASPSQIPWLPKLLDQVSKRPPEPITNDDFDSFETIPEVVQPETPAPAPSANLEKLLAGIVAQNMLQSPTFQQELMRALLPQQAQPAAQTNGGPAIDYRPKVIVVGLLPVQTNEVQAEYGKVFNLRFFNSNVPSQQIRESAKHCTFAILMTKFTSHSTAAALRAHPGFLFCNGNSSALKQMLQEKLTQLKSA